MAIRCPLLSETDAPKEGPVVIGTVTRDFHDIGKDLVGRPPHRLVASGVNRF